jgi:predicted membrane channel-forming protein YqfA (hemolysin III family)
MDTGAPQQSVFVTVVAWLGIVSSGFSVLIAVLQVVMIATTPSFGGHFFGEMAVFVLPMYAVMILGLLASIGLLRRKNWARLTIVALLIAGVLYFAGSVFYQWSFFGSVTSQDAEFARMARVMSYFMLVMAVGFAALAAWLVAKLCSKKVRAEFVR